MEFTRFLSGLCYLFPFSLLLACYSGMDGPGYKFAGLMISTLNHERASTYLIHDVGVEYNSLYEVSYKREKIQERTTTHSCSSFLGQ